MPTMTQHLVSAMSGVDPYSLTYREACTTIGRKSVIQVNKNVKLAKGARYGYLTGSLSLAPHTLAGLPTVCPSSTPECRRFCVSGSGQAIVFKGITQARISLTRLLHSHPQAFIRVLLEDLERGHALAARQGYRFAGRLNTFSDLLWEDIAPELFATARTLRVPLYDYTKVLSRRVPDSYHLTLSHSEVNRLADRALELTQSGINIAVPFDVPRNAVLPSRYRGARVIDGDQSDLRFLDPVGVIVGLRTKQTKQGKAHAPGGFVVDPSGATSEDPVGLTYQITRKARAA